MTLVPLPPFEPDKNRFNTGAMPETLNVRPVADGWAPLPSLVPQVPNFEVLTDENGTPLVDGDGNVLILGPGGTPLPGPIQLPSACLGSIFARTAGGTTRAFFGTQDTIYEYDFTNYVFLEVGTGYTVPVNGRWSFTQFGTDVYAQNGQDQEQVIDLVAGTTFAANATAPDASYIAQIDSFLVRARLVSDASIVQWSALNDPTSNDAGLDSSDEQFLPEGNGITGIVPVTTGAVVFCRDAIYLMNLVWNDFVFSFSLLTKYRGAIAPYAICSIGQDDFVFYASDGFFRGASQTPIGAERVDRWLLSQTDESARTQMVSAPDYRRKIVWFRYQNSAGAYRLLGYQWQLDRWLHSDADLADMLKIETPGVTIDGLDNLYDTIDDIDVPFDSSTFDGGSVEFGGITSTGFLAMMNGTNMAATISTNEISFNGTSRSLVNGGRLESDATNFTVSVSTTEYGGSSFRDRAAVSPSSRTKFLPFRADGRTHKFRAVIPEGESWSIVTALDVDVVGTGKS